MTSQRYLNDKVALKDFLRSLLGACKAPIAAVIIISFYILGPIIKFAKELKENIAYMELVKSHQIISYFGGNYENSDVYFEHQSPYIIMIICGIIVAFSLFSFAFKKNSVNVYFSVGINRVRLFLNRFAAGVAELLAVSIIPYLIMFLMNVKMFGFHPHQLKLFAFYSLLMFVSGVSGFAFGALAAAISGSAIEMLLTVGSSSVIFIAFAFLIKSLKEIFLFGFNSTYDYYDADEKLLLFTPWTALSERTDISSLITGKKVPNEFLLTWKTDFLPIALWAAASLIIFAVALFLFKKRKNEHTHSFGKYAAASAINGTAVFVISVVLLIEVFKENYLYIHIKSIPLYIVIIAALSFVIFFVAELIIRRNFKAVLRMLPVYGGCAAVTLASLIVIGTGYFGTYNKLPEIKDIEYISMSYFDPLGSLSYNTDWYEPKDYDSEHSNVCKSSNPEDIKMCFEQFNKIKDGKRFGESELQYAEFLIKTKDGKFISRHFPVYSEEIAHNYNKSVFNSEYFHHIIKAAVSAEPEYNADSEVIVSAEPEYNADSEVIVSDGPFIDAEMFDYYDSSLISSYESSEPLNPYENIVGTNYEITEELRQALYNDLCKITYDEYYGRAGNPTGALVRVSDLPMLETYQYTVMYNSLDFDLYENAQGKSSALCVPARAIIVYPQMTETAAVLADMEPAVSSIAVKSVIVPDKKLSIGDLIEDITSGSSGIMESAEQLFSAGEQLDFGGWLYGPEIQGTFSQKPNGTVIDFIEILYGKNDVKVSRVDDREKAEKISDAARVVYDTYGDNGRYVYVIYDDGSIVPKYLPEKSLSVLS